MVVYAEWIASAVVLALLLFSVFSPTPSPLLSLIVSPSSLRSLFSNRLVPFIFLAVCIAIVGFLSRHTRLDGQVRFPISYTTYNTQANISGRDSHFAETRNNQITDTMKCDLVFHLAAVAGLVSGRAVASNMDGAGILGGEHFRMALLPRQSVSSLQVFNGALGNVAASAITKTEEIDRPFGVDGSTFVCFTSGKPAWGEDTC